MVRLRVARVGTALAVALALGALASSAAARPKSWRVCLVSLSAAGEVEPERAIGMRTALEAGVDVQRRYTLVPYKLYTDVATAQQVPEAQLVEAASLALIGAELNLDVALLVVLSKMGDRHRLLVAAVDPSDGTQLGTASTWLKRPELSRAQAKSLLGPLLKDVDKLLGEAAEEPPPPPPPPPPAPATDSVDAD